MAESKKNNKKKKLNLKLLFEDFADGSTKFAGSATAFITAFVLILLWGITGPIFEFSQTWQIVINTATTIITFLMVFLIQHSQNKDSISLHVKLDEIIDSIKNADNYLIDSEDLSEKQLQILAKYYKKIEKKHKDDENAKHDKKKELEHKKDEIVNEGKKAA